jgi:hypothetical protein
MLMLTALLPLSPRSAVHRRSKLSLLMVKLTFNKIIFFFFFWIRGNLTSQKAYFVSPDEGVKPRLSQVLTKNTRPDSNSKQ